MLFYDPLTKYIKVFPEDFIVEEVLPFELKEEGKFSYYLLEKKNRGTLEVIDEISKTLKVPSHKIGFGGIKDKRAITKQYLSIEGKPKVTTIKGNNWKLRFVGYFDKPLEIGDIESNIFTVTIRNIEDKQKIKEAIKFIKEHGFANYFGEQRFRRNFVVSKPIGKLLLDGNIKETLKLYFTWHENPFIRRKLLDLFGNWNSFLKEATHLSLRERLVVKALKKGKTFEEAFKLLPKNIKLLIIFSYQSYLWNCILREIVTKNFSHFRVPFIIDKYIVFYNDVDKDKLDLLDKRIPYISKEALKEDLPEFIKEELLKIVKKEKLEEKLDTEIMDIKFFNKGERKLAIIPEIMNLQFFRDRIRLKFSLEAGSYATVMLRKIIFWKGKNKL
ncbi:MAG: tRNA pseudouridine(13) synthase TruD [Thermosulfidibacteraceae bacterium]|jgi:tRNA pseudouridine13 synthase